MPDRCPACDATTGLIADRTGGHLCADTKWCLARACPKRPRMSRGAAVLLGLERPRWSKPRARAALDAEETP